MGEYWVYGQDPAGTEMVPFSVQADSPDAARAEAERAGVVVKSIGPPPRRARQWTLWNLAEVLGCILVAYGVVNLYWVWQARTYLRDTPAWNRTLGSQMGEQLDSAGIAWKWSVPAGVVLVLVGYLADREKTRRQSQLKPL